MGIQQLREERTAKAREYRNILDNNPGVLSDEITGKLDALGVDISALDESIARHQKALDLEAEKVMAERVGEVAASKGGDIGRAVFGKWLRGGDKAVSAEEWTAIRNTMSTGTNSEGGYTVQTEVARQVQDALKAFGGMREVATVITTSGVGDINYPTSDGTSETGELIGENTTATAADPSFGVQTLKTYKFSSKIVAVPFELLQDSNVDIEAFVLNRLATRLGRVENTYFTTGTGSSQPRGVVTAASAGKTGTTGQTTTVIFDDLVDLVHSVDPAYRALGRCRFMLNDASLKIIRKLKDSQNRPIFLPGFDGLGAPMPDTILGYPVTINQDVATMAASAKSILFGDFSYYIIRDVMSATMFRFEDSAYVKLGQIGFLMWARSGGNFVDVGGAVKYYANSAS